MDLNTIKHMVIKNHGAHKWYLKNSMISKYVTGEYIHFSLGYYALVSFYISRNNGIIETKRQ